MEEILTGSITLLRYAAALKAEAPLRACALVLRIASAIAGVARAMRPVVVDLCLCLGLALIHGVGPCEP
jgi:hypothetical protein